MSRDELLSGVRKLRAVQGTDEEQINLLHELTRLSGYPELGLLIYHTTLTVEEVVDKALAYRPIQL